MVLTILKNMKVNGWWIYPNILWKIKHVWNHQSVMLYSWKPPFNVGHCTHLFLVERLLNHQLMVSETAVIRVFVVEKQLFQCWFMWGFWMSGSFEKKQTTASALEGPDTLWLIAFLWVLLARFWAWICRKNPKSWPSALCGRQLISLCVNM